MSQLSLDLEQRSSALDRFFADLEACTQKNALTHGLHPYPAKFIPHIPRALIQAFAPRYGTVLDPMCGSGTTLVEAAVNGHRSIGVDLNPIAVLVSRAKTTPLQRAEVAELGQLGVQVHAASLCLEAGKRLPDDFPSTTELPAFPNRDHWFHEHVALEILYATSLIQQLHSLAARTVALCALSAMIVAVSNQESETRWCAKPNDLKPGDTLRKFADKLHRSRARLAEYASLTPAPVTVIHADARRLALDDEIADFVVTSPPYANAHDYYLYNKLRLFWLGHDFRVVQAAEIGSRNRHSDQKEGIESYLDDMLMVLGEITRVLRPGRCAAVLVADALVHGRAYSMDSLITPLAENSRRLDLVKSFRFAHKKFNAAFQKSFGRAQQKVTHVLVFRKRS